MKTDADDLGKSLPREIKKIKNKNTMLQQES